MLRLSLLITATERVTAPVRRIRAAIGGMAKGGSREMTGLGRSFDRVASGAQRGADRIRRAYARIPASIGRIRASLRSLVVMGNRDIPRLTRITDRFANRVGTALGHSMRLLRYGTLAAAGGIGLMGRSIIGTSSKFEQFQVVLENTEGSAQGARKAMAWVQEFAKATPYEIGDVMEAFVQLKAYGIDPMNGSLKSLGNAASGMNKPLMAAIEMLADAQTGEFERLKEFGVRAKQQGEQVTLTYMNAGKEISVTSKKSSVEIQKALMGIFDARFAGMMDRQSRTLSGLWSNLKDQLSNFELDVGRAGIFDYIKNEIQGLLTKVNTFAANGTLKRWAKQLSAMLVDLAKKFQQIDWLAIGQGIVGIAKALGAVVAFAGWIERVFGLVNIGIVLIIGKIAFALYGLGTALGIVSIAGAPLWAVVAVIAVLAAGAFLVWRNWGKISAFFGRMWEGIKSAFTAGVAAVWASLPAWMRGIFSGAKFAINLVGNLFQPDAPAPTGAAPRPRAQPRVLGRRGDRGRSFITRSGRPLTLGPPLRQPVSRPMMYKSAFGARAQTDIRQKLDIDIRTDQGTRATVRRMTSSDQRAEMNVAKRGRLNVA